MQATPLHDNYVILYAWSNRPLSMSVWSSETTTFKSTTDNKKLGKVLSVFLR
jgi:hypothetical protein